MPYLCPFGKKCDNVVSSKSEYDTKVTKLAKDFDIPMMKLITVTKNKDKQIDHFFTRSIRENTTQ